MNFEFSELSITNVHSKVKWCGRHGADYKFWRLLCWISMISIRIIWQKENGVKPTRLAMGRCRKTRTPPKWIIALAIKKGFTETALSCQGSRPNPREQKHSFLINLSRKKGQCCFVLFENSACFIKLSQITHHWDLNIVLGNISKKPVSNLMYMLFAKTYWTAFLRRKQYQAP